MSGTDPRSGPLDAAMWTVWQAGPWRALTEDMAPAEREAAADAVLRHQVVLNAAGAVATLMLPDEMAELRWWR